MVPAVVSCSYLAIIVASVVARSSAGQTSSVIADIKNNILSPRHALPRNSSVSGDLKPATLILADLKDILNLMLERLSCDVTGGQTSCSPVCM